jgi:hypothetical protein
MIFSKTPNKIQISKNQKGQALLEYVLMLSISIILTGIVYKAALAGVDKMALLMGAKVENQLRTGNVTSPYWRN